jgi:hypothetical protein
MNGVNQVFVYVDRDNLLGENINSIMNNAEILLQASKEIGLEVNIDKIKFVM